MTKLRSERRSCARHLLSFSGSVIESLLFVVTITQSAGADVLIACPPCNF